MMNKTGAPQQPQEGKCLTPWPSKVLVFKAEDKGFVPQPLVTSKTCPACHGSILRFPDGKEVCQNCGMIHAQENMK